MDTLHDEWLTFWPTSYVLRRLLFIGILSLATASSLSDVHVRLRPDNLRRI